MHRPGTAHKAMEAAMERTDTGKALPRRATGRRAMRTGAQPRTMGSPLPAPSSMLPGQGPRMQGTGRGQPGTARGYDSGYGQAAAGQKRSADAYGGGQGQVQKLFPYLWLVHNPEGPRVRRGDTADRHFLMLPIAWQVATCCYPTCFLQFERVKPAKSP